MKKITFIVWLLVFPLICFAQDAVTQATPKCKEYRGDKDSTVYAIIEIKVLDEAIYGEYVKKARPIVENYNGRYIVRSNEITSISGDWNPQRLVIIEFPSFEDLKSFLNCPEYKEIQALRESSTQGSMIVVGKFLK